MEHLALFYSTDSVTLDNFSDKAFKKYCEHQSSSIKILFVENSKYLYSLQIEWQFCNKIKVTKKLT